MALGAAPASARLVHPYKFQITEAGGTNISGINGLAVDSAGNLYATDSSHGALDKFDSSGAPVTSWGTNGQITEAAGTPFTGGLSGLAVDSSDNVWISDTGSGAVYEFGSAGTFLTQAEGPEPGGAFPFGGSYIQSLAWSDAANRLFVADSGGDVLWGIEPNGSYSGTNFSAGLGEGCCFIKVAADNSAGATGADLYVAVGNVIHRIHGSGLEAGEPDIFSESASYLEEEGRLTGTPAGSFASVDGLAVDSAGHLYVTQPGEIDEYASSGEFVGKITGTPTGPGGAQQPFEFLHPVGVNASSGNLYAYDGRVPMSIYAFEASAVVVPDVTTLAGEVHSVTEATLNGEVNPDEIPLTECFFEYGETIAYGQTAECEPDAAALGEGNAPVAVEAQLENLTPGATYHYRLVAANANGTNDESGDQVFFTGASIDATSASEVSATAATLETEINPHGFPATYRFQYGTSAAYGATVPVPDGSAGSGLADVARSVQVQGLEPSTEYHYRVVVRSELAPGVFEELAGPDREFITQPASATTLLPDARSWELVSPPNKHGALLEAISDEGAVIQAAADGSGLAYVARGSVDSSAPGSRSAADSQLLATRGPAGWTSTDISTPHRAPAGLEVGHNSEYKLFSSDLSLGAVEPTGATPLSPLATERTPYRREADGSYTPYVYPGNVPAETKFGGKELNPEHFANGVHFITATSDLTHVLLESPIALTAEFPGFDPPYSAPVSIYEWSGSGLHLVSQIPIGPAATCGGSGPACIPASEESRNSAVGVENYQVRHAISADGSRVVFQTTTGVPQGAPSLFLRDISSGETVALDAAEAGCGASCESGGATYQDASADGSRIFFTDASRLTADSTAALEKPDLYMCEVEETPGGLACDLTDLTVNTVHPSEPAGVQGTPIGASDDGSSLYFVAQGALTETLSPAGESAISGDCKFDPVAKTGFGRCNLYHLDTETGSIRLVSVLSGQDFPDWAQDDKRNLSDLTTRVSPNGRYLAFMSERPLTGYDNRDAVTAQRDQEVFLYDAATDVLSCASCNPTGARPRGVFDPGGFPGLLVDHPEIWRSHTVAASVPGWTRVDLVHALYQSRYLSDSGRLFFNAADALAAADTNGTFDVYQYEPPGVGGCAESSQTFSARNSGCVSLISSGTSPDESAFLDASESGDDVFFLTASRLTGRDLDSALDVYDARVGGGEAEPVKPVECSGDACQQPATPPNDQTPGSLTFQGAGNLLQCPKGKVKQNGKCVVRHERHKGKKHKHRAKHHRKGTVHP